jgi:hypothetical protein
MIDPTLISTIGNLVEIVFRIGVTEGPIIANMISAAIHGTDPLAALAKETVAGIMPGLQLELAMAAEHVRRAHLAAGGV